MKKSLILGLTLTLGTLCYLPQLALSQEDGKVESLRGDNPIPAMSEKTAWKKVPSDFQTVSRDFIPLIRHFVEGYQVVKGTNQCLTCHKRVHSNRRIHINEQENNIDTRYYFCNSCHVPQIDAEPLIDNILKAAND